jgi:DNA (cytosine-5)-methyltransferase 1
MRPVKDGIVPTLNARMGTGGNQVPVIQEPVCLDIANPRSNPTYNIAPTLCARMGTGGNQVPVIHCKPYCIGNGQVDQAKLSEKVGALNCMHDQQAVMNDYKVRRLTPTECERLQGLPDGYTYGGSDSARYKALGNGMAQPCADFVMQRIVEVSAMKDRMAEMGAHG